MKIWNKVFWALITILLLAGCNDSSKADNDLNKAKDSPKEMKEATE